jgi:glycosyltransferase involved in cell wall biosynthesis
VFSPFSLSVLVATALFGGTPVAVIADLPQNVYDFKGIWRGLLQRIDFYIQTHSIHRFAALIPLTRQTAEDFAPGLPALVIEGGVDANVVENMDTVSTYSQSTLAANEKVVFYSGSIDQINGVDLLIEAFQLLPDPHYRLHIFGQGPMLPMVREAMDKDKRILYGGVLPNPEIMCRQAQATILVNPRPSYRKITRYTFPSKVLEYMVSGRPTITTVLPGIPEEYYPYLFLLRDETPNGLAQLIEDVCSQGTVELEQYGQQARDFVIQNKNWVRQGKRIYEFIRQL